MNDPCIGCIVQPNCSQLCPDRQNYIALCNDAMKYFKKNHSPFALNINSICAYRGQYRKSLRRQDEMFKRNHKILRVYEDYEKRKI